MSKNIVDIWKTYVGKKVYVQTTEKGKNRRVLGTLQFVNDKFIVVNTDNPSFYKEAITIAIDKIEILTLLSNSYESHQSKLQPIPSPSTPAQPTPASRPKLEQELIAKADKTASKQENS